MRVCSYLCDYIYIYVIYICTYIYIYIYLIYVHGCVYAVSAFLSHGRGDEMSRTHACVAPQTCMHQTTHASCLAHFLVDDFIHNITRQGLRNAHIYTSLLASLLHRSGVQDRDNRHFWANIANLFNLSDLLDDAEDVTIFALAAHIHTPTNDQILNLATHKSHTHTHPPTKSYLPCQIAAQIDEHIRTRLQSCSYVIGGSRTPPPLPVKLPLHTRTPHPHTSHVR